MVATGVYLTEVFSMLNMRMCSSLYSAISWSSSLAGGGFFISCPYDVGIDTGLFSSILGKDVCDMLQKSSEVKIFHILSDGNSCADFVAILCRQHQENMYYQCFFPKDFSS